MPRVFEDKKSPFGHSQTQTAAFFLCFISNYEEKHVVLRLSLGSPFKMEVPLPS